jgi:hypothetical protein
MPHGPESGSLPEYRLALRLEREDSSEKPVRSKPLAALLPPYVDSGGQQLKRLHRFFHPAYGERFPLVKLDSWTDTHWGGQNCVSLPCYSYYEVPLPFFST